MKIVIGSPSYTVEVGLGDWVIDDLTRERVQIVRIETHARSMSAGVWVSSNYLDGARHPGELTPIPPTATPGE